MLRGMGHKGALHGHKRAFAHGHRRGYRSGASLGGGGVALGAALILFGLGAWEAFYLGRLFHGGAHAEGYIVSVDRERDDTRIRVAGAECPVTGDVGPVGRNVAVVYPHGHPIDCVVRTPNAFRWSAGAMLLGGAILLVVVYQARRAA
jgi:hypothetical protein